MGFRGLGFRAFHVGVLREQVQVGGLGWVQGYGGLGVWSLGLVARGLLLSQTLNTKPLWGLEVSIALG